MCSVAQLPPISDKQEICTTNGSLARFWIVAMNTLRPLSVKSGVNSIFARRSKTRRNALNSSGTDVNRQISQKLGSIVVYPFYVGITEILHLGVRLQKR